MNVKRFPLVLEAEAQNIIGYDGMKPLAALEELEGTLILFCECPKHREAPPAAFSVRLYGSDNFGKDVIGAYVDTVRTSIGTLHVYIKEEGLC